MHLQQQDGLLTLAAATACVDPIWLVVGTAPSNVRFDASLQERDPRWGLRQLEDVASAADEHGLLLQETVPMPANNLSVVFTRR